MIPTLGYYSLMSGAAFSLCSFLIVIFGIKFKSYTLVRNSKIALSISFIFVTLTSSALLYSLLNRDFRLEYVYEHSSRSLSLLYTISAFWAGQKGSLLFWAWLMALFNFVLILSNRKEDMEFFPYVVSIISFIQFFFLFLLVKAANPFTKMNFVPSDGYGLNPLLQNPGMIWHPPTLFIGYVGYTIPFAFGVAALISKKLDNEWLKNIRRWSLFSWFFLSVGILLGAQWAYVELGWGGYWAWDPIENASLMPWLTGTAFLHSAIIYERKGMMRTWNLILIILTFTLCIFGTFLTRSGVLSSVHAFGESGVGIYFIGFIALCLILSFSLLIIRKNHLGSPNEISSMISKDGMFLLNSFILVGIFFVVFFGTMFPVFSEVFVGTKLTVSQSYFNKVSIPLGLILLGLMAICPLSPSFKRNSLLPAIVSGISLVIFYASGVRKFIPLTSFTFIVFVMVTIFIEFYKGAPRWRNRRKYGGHIVHLGIVLMYIGMTGIGAYSIEENKTLRLGENLEIGRYKLVYDDFQNISSNVRERYCALLTVYKNDKPLFRMRPEKNFYPNYEQPTTEVAIASNLLEDLYVILGSYNPESGTANFKVFVNPLVIWMWLGGIVIFIGTAIAFWPDKRRCQV